MRIRQPIISVLGHVDSGKTSILDYIRGSFVAKGEAGGITQHIGASEIPITAVKDICGTLAGKLGVEIKIPGLLFIDTPGHEAFANLRKRGGSIADLAVLVIDVNEGFQPQTDESLLFLKEFKTPFVVAATKIDRILGYRSKANACFIENFRGQDNRSQDELEEKIYRIVGQLGEKGFNSERFDRIEDFSKQVGIVPVSAITGEGVPDLLVLLAGLSQKFLEKRLEITEERGKGTVLEVREFRGLGTTLDVILYDGTMERGDVLVIGGREIITTRVKAILKPEPMKEIRVERRFIPMQEVSAAAGIKISAPNIENVIAGSPLIAVRTESEAGKAREEIKREIEDVEIEAEIQGAIIKADTLGSLEALIKTFMDLNIPIRKAKVGNVVKADVMESSAMKKPVIFAFHVTVLPDAEALSEKTGVKIFSSNIIYRLLEEYKEWEDILKKGKEDEMLDHVTRPGRVRVLKGYVFRQSKPAIFGVEVIAGVIKPGVRMRKDGKVLGEVREIQAEGDNVREGKAGDKLAMSMDGVVMGRHISEGDVLETNVTERDMEILKKIKHKLNPDERELLEEMNK